MLRLIDWMAVTMLGAMAALVAAWAVYTVWAETLRPLIAAIGGA